MDKNYFNHKYKTLRKENMPKKIRLGILGGGGDSLIGILHRAASQINDNYEVVGAVFNPDRSEERL